MSEDQLHNTVAQFLALSLPADVIAHHSMNEGKRGWQTQRKLKRFGMVKGWPDLEIVAQGRVYFIELKAPGRIENGCTKGKGYLSPEQRECHDRLRNAGCAVAVCRSLEEVQEALWGWQIIEKRAA